MRLFLGNPANIKSSLVKNYDHSYPNLGLLYVAGSVKQQLPNAEMFYAEGNVSIGDYLKSIQEFKPDVVGIYISTFIAPLAYMTINAIREMDPSIPIICGGPHPTVDHATVFNNCNVDICAIGEADETIVEILKYYMGQTTLDQIAGIAYKKDGAIAVTGKRPFEKNIDKYYPDWSLVDFKNYLGLVIRKSSPQSHVLVSRGCPYDCVFCSNPVWKSDKPWLRVRSPESIQREVKELYERGVREIFLRADEFNCNLKWAKAVCNAIIALNCKDLHFTCNLRVDKVDDEFAENLAKMQCWLVHIGIESANQRVIDGIEKRYTIEQVKNSCAIFKRHGVKVYGYFMMYAIWEDKEKKLCIETPEEVEKTFSFIKYLSSHGQLHYISWAFCTPYQGARLYDISLRHGIISKDYNGDPFDLNVDLGISRKHMKRSLRRGIIMQFYLIAKNGNAEVRLFKRALYKIYYAIKSLVAA